MSTVRIAFLHLAPCLRDLQANRRLIDRAVTTAATSGATWILIGEDDKAEALVQHMERDIAQARASIPSDAPALRVMLYGQAGYTGGAHTTFDDMVQAVGATNIAAAHGVTGFRKISSEQLIQWNPDVIITSADCGTPNETRRQLLHDPAVAVTTAGKHQRIIVIPNRIFLTVTHHITQGIAQLARELYYPES